MDTMLGESPARNAAKSLASDAVLSPYARSKDTPSSNIGYQPKDRLAQRSNEFAHGAYYFPRFCDNDFRSNPHFSESWKHQLASRTREAA